MFLLLQPVVLLFSRHSPQHCPLPYNTASSGLPHYLIHPEMSMPPISWSRWQSPVCSDGSSEHLRHKAMYFLRFHRFAVPDKYVTHSVLQFCPEWFLFPLQGLPGYVQTPVRKNLKHLKILLQHSGKDILPGRNAPDRQNWCFVNSGWYPAGWF